MARQAPPGGRVLAVLAVAALAVGVGALSIFALERTEPSGPVKTASPAPTFDFGGTPTATPASPAPTQSTSRPADEERFLAVQGSQLWRATAGTCDSEGALAPNVERSLDAGATWTPATPTDARRVLNLSAPEPGSVEIIAAVGSGCAPTSLRAYTEALAWQAYPPSASTYVSPSDRGTVEIAGRPVAAPCENAHSARTSRERTGVICDGAAYAWIDDSWVSLVSGAVALDAEAGTVVVAHVSAACEGGVAVTRFTGTEGRDLGCVSGVDAASPAALSVLGADVALWSGGDIRALD